MSRSLRVGEAFSLNFHYFVIWRVKEGLEVRGLDRLHSVSIFYRAINTHKVLAPNMSTYVLSSMSNECLCPVMNAHRCGV